MPRPIANVYLDRGQNLVVRTTPGRQIQFLGGHVAIKEESDLTPILRMPNATVVVDAESVDWVSKWLKACGDFPHEQAQAVIELPDGVKLYPPDYAVAISADLNVPPEQPVRRGPGRPRKVVDEDDETIFGWNPR